MGYEAYHKGKYYVTFKRGFEDCKRDIVVTVDKVFEKDTLRVILSDDEEPSFLCVLYVTRCDYEDLKKQQGLLIDFDNFPSQLVRLLQQCSSNNMFLILQQSNPVQYYFEIVEHNEFRRLVHLSLKTAPATDTEIKKHMSDTIGNLKKGISIVKSSLQSSEATWSDKCIMMERKIHDLTLAVAKMEEDKLRRETEHQEALRHEKDRLTQERLQWQKNSDMSIKTQVASVQDIILRKDKQIDELNSLLKQHKDSAAQLENQLSEKNQRLNMLEIEVQKAHIEVATIKAKNASLERELMEKERQCHHINLKCSDLEKTIREHTDNIQELNNSLKLLKKEKTSLEERLAISESLVNRNNEAAHSTTEQLLKANQIISKQNSDLIEMKEKILCRTAIALEQEKVIERNSKEMEYLKTELSDTRQSLEKVKCDFESLKEKYEANEKTLKDKEEVIKNNNMVIQWLHKKMEDNCLESESRTRQPRSAHAASSTPYFLTNKNHSDTLHGLSDESINFYATSKSDVEESPRYDSPKANGSAGLDPKYLEPASDDRQLKTSSRSKSTDRKSALVDANSLKGKENKNADLPKIDYREKKTGRGTATYRSTPVSAYFP